VYSKNGKEKVLGGSGVSNDILREAKGERKC